MTESTKPRYDGLATWYEDYNAKAAKENRGALTELLGRGEGWCLDLGCGTGQYFDAIRSTGRTPVGLDRSGDQLRIASRRDRAVLQADAAALPFADATFPTVVSLWASTDVDDWGRVMRETARVLRPGGLFVFYGVHPCFNGPHVQNRDDGARIIHPVYREAGWHEDAPWWSSGGVRRQLGMRHLPLSDLLNGVLDAGLALARVREPREHAIPFVLAFSARRPLP
ncbi:class I SAM-dependent methyltransferase [Glycomyces buryatensis]|uniref:Class I SAM-dependent methyltransferase n=1 Tax=Glycomyces buryatensis TaxID=2570927 RepID=A0A4V4HQ84_9ACTN|nr:class I SAM-dependent methyltransferase [Glycomyces buryatensis]THV32876.1 class I SAM-dependent methyltransferase [Glycomyces buryatensis]